MTDLRKDPDGDINPDSIGKDEPAELVNTEDAIHNPREKRVPAVGKRPIISTEAKTYVVDPNGSIDAAGTAADPLSLKGLFAKIPRTIQHDFTAEFNDGTYTIPETAINTPVSTIIGDNSVSVNFTGNTATPGNVVFDIPYVNIQVHGRDYGQHLWEGIEFRSLVQPYAANVQFENCNFRSNTSLATQTCIGGYSSAVVVQSCDFGGNANYAFTHSTAGSVMFRDCTGSLGNALMRTGGSGLLRVKDNGGNTVSYPDLREFEFGTFVTDNQVTDTGGFAVDESAFIAKGDFQPEFTLTPMGTSTLSTTATSYTGDIDVISYRYQNLRSQFPDGADIAVSINGRLNVGTDETVDVRLQDTSAGETLVEQTGFTTTQFHLSIGPVVIPETALDGNSEIELQIRNSNGVNSSSFARPSVVFGIQV